MEVASLADPVADLKAKLASVLQLPANRQKLQRDGVGMLQDTYSMAFYNLGPDVVLQLGVKERGGRKK